MKKIILSVCLLACFSMFFVACSDDDNSTNTTPSNNSLLSLKVGNYWIYDSWDLDNNNQKKTSSYTSDSLYVVKDTTLYNYPAYKCIRNSNGLSSVEFFRVDGGKVYTSEKIFTDLLSRYNLPIDVSQFALEQKWYVLADNNATSEWQIAQTTLSNLQFSGVNINATINIKGKKGATGSVTLNGKNYTTQDFILTYSINAGLATVTILNFSNDFHYTFIEGVGLYQINSDYSTALTTQIPGYLSVLNHYKLF